MSGAISYQLSAISYQLSAISFKKIDIPCWDDKYELEVHSALVFCDGLKADS